MQPCTGEPAEITSTGNSVPVSGPHAKRNSGARITFRHSPAMQPDPFHSLSVEKNWKWDSFLFTFISIFNNPNLNSLYYGKQRI
jgi:hypothetical protein